MEVARAGARAGEILRHRFRRRRRASRRLRRAHAAAQAARRRPADAGIGLSGRRRRHGARVCTAACRAASVRGVVLDPDGNVVHDCGTGELVTLTRTDRIVEVQLAGGAGLRRSAHAAGRAGGTGRGRRRRIAGGRGTRLRAADRRRQGGGMTTSSRWAGDANYLAGDAMSERHDRRPPRPGSRIHPRFFELCVAAADRAALRRRRDHRRAAHRHARHHRQHLADRRARRHGAGPHPARGVRALSLGPRAEPGAERDLGRHLRCRQCADAADRHSRSCSAAPTSCRRCSPACSWRC